MACKLKKAQIHRHIGGLENYLGLALINMRIHRHIGGLEIIDNWLINL